MDGIALEHLGATTVLRCNRSLTLSHVQEFMNLFSTLVQRQEMDRIMFVFSPQTRLDATGAGVLVQMHAILVGSNKRLYLCMPPPEVLELLRELQLHNFLRILGSDEDLLLRLPD